MPQSTKGVHECHIYSLNLELKLRNSEDKIRKHTNMSKWLREKGDHNVIYELWKFNGLHSRWKWKKEKKRWGKMPTPKK